MKLTAEELAPFLKLPAVDLVEIYADTLVKYATLKVKLDTGDEKEKADAADAIEKLKFQVLTNIKQLYKNIGVDLSEEAKKITKNYKENSVII